MSYDWDFGDGSIGTGVSPTHTYPTDGTFNVTLAVTDDENASDSAMTTATISNGDVDIEAEDGEEEDDDHGRKRKHGDDDGGDEEDDDHGRKRKHDDDDDD